MEKADIIERMTQVQALRASEVARMFGCSKQYVSKLVRKGELNSYRLGDRGWHRITVHSIREFAAKHAIPIKLPMSDEQPS